MPAGPYGFLMVVPAAEVITFPPGELMLVQNWPVELARLAPVP